MSPGSMVSLIPEMPAPGAGICSGGRGMITNRIAAGTMPIASKAAPERSGRRGVWTRINATVVMPTPMLRVVVSACILRN